MTKAAELAKMGEVLTNSQIGGRRNIAYNGAMQISQRSTSVTGIGSASGYFTLDRYKIIASATAGRVTMSQSTDAPNGFSNSLKFDCTTADTSIASGEYFFLSQYLEGQDLQQLKKGTSDAEKVTVSFYVKGNASATYTLELEDADNSRQNSQEFSVTTSWTRVVKTFVGDTTGTLNNDNGNSLNLNIILHSGSDVAGGTHTSNVWHTTTNQRAGDNLTSIFDSTDREFFITGLQIEVGSQATPFEHRSFGEELLLCSRYCRTYTGQNFGRTRDGDSYYGGGLHFNPPLRSTPTLKSGATFETNTGNAGTPAINSGLSPTADSVQVYNSDSSWTTNAFVRLTATFEAEL